MSSNCKRNVLHFYMVDIFSMVFLPQFGWFHLNIVVILFPFVAGIFCYNFGVEGISFQSHHQRTHTLKCDSAREMPSRNNSNLLTTIFIKILDHQFEYQQCIRCIWWRLLGFDYYICKQLEDGSTPEVYNMFLKRYICIFVHIIYIIFSV